MDLLSELAPSTRAVKTTVQVASPVVEVKKGKEEPFKDHSSTTKITTFVGGLLE